MGRPIQFQSAVYLGIDTVHALTAAQCDALVSAGYSWVARYLPLDGAVLDEPDRHGGDHMGCWSLSIEESRTILQAGLCILPIQWGPSGGDRLDAAMGQIRGQAMRSAARQLGIPPEVHLWCDWEGHRAEIAGRMGGRAYLEAWAAGEPPAGLYVSLPQPLSGRELYGLRCFTSYWAAANQVEAPLPRDYSIRQGLQTHICGIPCDPDVMRPDCRGEMPVLWGL